MITTFHKILVSIILMVASFSSYAVQPTSTTFANKTISTCASRSGSGITGDASCKSVGSHLYYEQQSGQNNCLQPNTIWGYCKYQSNSTNDFITYVFDVTCPSNSTKTGTSTSGRSCTCNAGYTDTGSSCVQQPTCTAPYALDPATNTCQLTACPIGMERVPPSTSCTPIQCTAPQVLNEQGQCYTPPCQSGYERLSEFSECVPVCPDKTGQQVESLLCSQWHEEIDGCKYPVNDISEQCTTKYIMSPLGLPIPYKVCKSVGKISAADGRYTIPTLACDSTRTITEPLQINLNPLTDAEKQAYEQQKQQTQAQIDAAKLAEQQAQQASTDAYNQQLAQEKLAAEQKTSQAKAAAEAAKAAQQQAAQTALITMANTIKTEAEQATLQYNTANQAYISAQSAYQANPTDTTAQQNYALASENLALATSNMQLKTAIASQAAAAANQYPITSGSQGDSNMQGCGDLSCESTQQMVKFNTETTNKLLMGQGTDITSPLTNLTNISDLNLNESIQNSMTNFDNLQIIEKITKAFSDILPVSPWELIKNSATPECSFTFNLLGQSYVLSMCEAIPYLHPALSFMFFIIFVVAVFALIFERPQQ